MAVDLFVVPFQNTIEPQNTEQGISNVEVGSATVPTWIKRARSPALLLYFPDTWNPTPDTLK
jgi:hypothetical protein